MSNTFRLLGSRLAAPLLASIALLTGAPVHAQGTCAGEPLCREVPKFTATITDFRVSPNTVGNRPISLTVRFTNRTATPLVLGYVSRTAAAYDDRGNKYALQNNVKLQGIGVIERSRFDPKFTLGPGESSDAKLEVNFFVNRNVIVGTEFDFEMSVREIDPQPGNQFRLGREHALSWQHLKNGAGGRAPAVAGVGAAAGGGPVPASTAAMPAGGGDPCGGAPSCASSGPVVAKLAGISAGAPKGNNHEVTVRIAFQNVGSTPLILNYKQNTGTMLDERGEKYIVDSRYRESVQGIPVSTRDRASSQFTLQPGESRTAAFVFRRYVGKVPPGTVFSPSIAVEQYELLASNQLRLEREHALGFLAARAGGGAANLGDAIRGIGDLLKKKQ